MADLKTKAGTQDVESASAMYYNASSGLTFSPEMTGDPMEMVMAGRSF